MLRAIVSADGEAINELHMQKKKKKKAGEFARTFFLAVGKWDSFWLFKSSFLSEDYF